MPLSTRLPSKLLCLTLLLLIPLAGKAAQIAPLGERLDRLLARLDPALAVSTPGGLALPAAHLQTRGCENYPYNRTSPGAQTRLIEDLRSGLRRGIACLAGQGPAGRLHPYHEYQAHRLLSVLESKQRKTFRCVADQMFANAVASTKQLPPRDDALYRLLRETPHPAVVLDTFRIGGLLSTRHSPDTYRSFFKLSDKQIREHLTGSPLRLGGNHRYRQLPALLFHEMVHWLGHEHSGVYPDIAHLYETCCFGGSDFIDDAQSNAGFAQRACGILQDAELWADANSPYRKMRLWRHKGYDQLKLQMREHY